LTPSIARYVCAGVGGCGSDEIAAARTVMEFVDAVGFDPVYIGTLDHSVLLQPEAPLFGAALSASDIEDHLPSHVNLRLPVGSKGG
jgi:predicted dinucleotide-binding enzyme